MTETAEASSLSGSHAASKHRAMYLLLLALAVWAGGYARVAVGPLQEAMGAALALSDNQIALLQGPAIAMSVMLGSIPIGLLIDRYCRVRLLLAFVAMDLAGSILTALAASFLVLFVARSLVGLASIASVITAYSLIADLYAPAQRGRATMIVSSGELASPVAFALGGALLVAYGTSAEAWRSAMLWMTVPPLILVTALMVRLREPPRSGVIVRGVSVSASFQELWRYRTLVAPLLVGRCMVWIADGATVIWAAPFLARRFHLAPDRVGAIMATVLLVAGIVATIAGGFLADLCQRAGGPRRTLSALSVAAIASVPASLFGVAPNAGIASVLLVAFITLGFITNIAGATLSTIVVPNEVRAMCLSATMVVGSFCGIAVAPLLVSSLAGALGGPLAIGEALAIVCAGASALGAATLLYGRRYFPGRAPS